MLNNNFRKSKMNSSSDISKSWVGYHLELHLIILQDRILNIYNFILSLIEAKIYFLVYDLIYEFLSLATKDFY